MPKITINQKSDTLTPEDVRVVKTLLSLGFQHKRIAALFDVNQGRISEINSGRKFAYVPMLDGKKCRFYPIKGGRS